MSKILIVDDEKSIQTALSILLGNQGYHIDVVQDGVEAWDRLNQEQYDLVLTDIVMPRMNGLELVQQIKQRWWGKQLPVIAFTANAAGEQASKVKDAGASDLITKPFEAQALFHAVERLLISGSSSQVQLETRVQQELTQCYTDTIQALFATIEAKDESTLSHSARVACYALLLAKRQGLNELDLRNLEYLALLHDIGKIAIPASLLQKKMPLADSEIEVYKNHVLIGEMIISPLNFIPGGSKIIRHHHEWFNGEGYPDHLQGDQIPLFSRIITIADVFDEWMTSAQNPVGKNQEKIIDQMIAREGKQFDPGLLQCFLRAYCKILMINEPLGVNDPTPATDNALPPG